VLKFKRTTGIDAVRVGGIALEIRTGRTAAAPAAEMDRRDEARRLATIAPTAVACLLTPPD